MLRKMLGWAGEDVNVPCICTHVGSLRKLLGWVGGIVNVPHLLHMLDATQGAGLGWGGCERSLHLHRWQWRRSCDIDLFTSLGQACKKLRR